MSSETAHWFLPDQEYYGTTEDHAIVGASAKLVRREIDHGNAWPFPISEDYPKDPRIPKYYSDFLRMHKYQQVYQFAVPGMLIYADVNEDQAGHVEEIKRLSGRDQEKLAGLDGKTEAARRALIDHFVNHEPFEPRWYYGIRSFISKETEDDERFKKEKARYYSDWFMNRIVRSHVLDRSVVNYLAGPGHAQARELMDLISEQSLLKKKRPVMLLVDIIDDFEDTTWGSKSGWVIGYDIIKNVIIINRFHSDKTTHPLGGPWDSARPDQVVGRWTPTEFAEQYIQLVETFKQQIAEGTIREIEKTGEQQAGDLVSVHDADRTIIWQMLVHTLAIRPLFQGVLEQQVPNLVPKAKQAYLDIKGSLKRTPFEAKPKEKPSEPMKLQIGPFEELEWDLEEMEDHFRCAAVDCEEAGLKKAAENSRLMYERLYGMLKKFNEDPENVDVSKL